MAVWMAVWMAWTLDARWGHHWAVPLALAMVLKKASERVVLWARKKAAKWDVYLVVKTAVRWAELSAILKKVA